MKWSTKFLELTILLILIGCVQTSEQDKKMHTTRGPIQTDTTRINLPKEERQKQREEESRIDSLRLDSALRNAFKIARPAFKGDNLTKYFELQPDDSSYTIAIDIVIGNLFKDKHKYFLLRRRVPWATYLDLFKISDEKAEKIIEREQGSMNYIRDTIFDANGDGFKDFLVHSYPSSGCCRRDVYHVYLNQPHKESFTQEYQFINPTFSAKEKIIRGVEYGHPGEVGLYKYKWNGLQVDTIEFIYPNIYTRGQFIKTNKPAYRPTFKEGVVLKAVPKEYHNVESYEWFTSY